MTRKQGMAGHAGVLLAAMAVGLAPEMSAAATRTWTEKSTGDGTTWSDAGNWKEGTAPQNGDDIKYDYREHNTDVTDVTTTNNVDTPITIRSLWFDSTRFTPGRSFVLTNQTITVSPTATPRWTERDVWIDNSRVTIACDIAMDDNVTIQVSGGDAWPLRLAGAIRDGGAGHRLTLNGGNSTRTYLTGDNAFGGGFELIGGSARLYLGHTNALGSGSVRLAPTAGFYLYADQNTIVPGPLTIARSFWYERERSAETPGGGFTLAFSGDILVTNTPLTMTVDKGRLALDGNITERGGTGGLIYEGLGTTGSLRLGGSNTLVGPLTVTPNSSARCNLILAHPQALKGILILKGASGRETSITAEGVDVTIPAMTTDAAYPRILDLLATHGGRLVAAGTQDVEIGRTLVRTNVTLALSGELKMSTPSWGSRILGIGATGTTSGDGGGTLSPAGSDTGILTIDGGDGTGVLLFWDHSSRLVMDLNGVTPGTEHDQLVLKANTGQSRLRCAPSGEGATLVLRVGRSVPPDARLFIIVNDSGSNLLHKFNGLAADGAEIDLGEPFGKPASCRISYSGDAAAGTITGGNDVVLYGFVNTVRSSPTVIAIY